MCRRFRLQATMASGLSFIGVEIFEKCVRIPLNMINGHRSIARVQSTKASRACSVEQLMHMPFASSLKVLAAFDVV